MAAELHFDCDLNALHAPLERPNRKTVSKGRKQTNFTIAIPRLRTRLISCRVDYTCFTPLQKRSSFRDISFV
jgi:hypothetical protein